MNECASLGQWIAARRKSLRLRQNELARMAACAEITLRKIEADERRPSSHLAEALAAHLTSSPDEHALFVRVAEGERQVHDLTAPAVHVVPRAPTPARSKRDNVPRPATSLVGRDADVAQVKQRLTRQDVRLLTLVGPPGVGKTRLALQVASEVSEAASFAGEVYFVALAPVATVEFVLSAIAQSLGVIPTSNVPLMESVKNAIHNRRVLLVLDNFEHVPEAAPHVAVLLASSPQLTVLVTSRAALRLSDEHEFVVTSLAMAPALDLLIQRAQAVKPDLTLTEANTPTMTAICNRLDRLPLAIELAAARLKLFTPEALFARLAAMPLEMLTNGASDLPARQRTLRTTIDWSYSLLAPAEQVVFRQLGVFAGGFTLASAEAVTGASWEVLSSLLDKSLITLDGEPAGEPRFRLLELLREYALAKLNECGETEDARRRHAAYFVALAEAAEPNLLNAEQVRWMRRLNSELDNLRAALRWAQDRGEYEVTMRIMGPTWRYWWWTPGLSPEGFAWIRPALHDDPAISLIVRARAWFTAGALAVYAADAQSVKRLSEYSLMLAERAEDSDVIGLAFTGATVGNIVAGDYEAAKLLNDRALSYTADMISWGRASALILRATNFQPVQDYHRELSLADEARVMFHQLGDSNGEIVAVGYMCDIARNTEDYGSVLKYAHEGLTMTRQQGLDCIDGNTVYILMHDIGLCAGWRGQADAMARLCGAAVAGWLKVKPLQARPDVTSTMSRYAVLCGELTDERVFVEQWIEGSNMTLEQAVDYALEVADSLSQIAGQRDRVTSESNTAAV
jgi:predicted ATPase/transcriptional regulator with XRE-family HTH domain